MKRLISIVLYAVLMVLSFTSRAQHTFYIYRNDGCINVFDTEYIDSLIYSRLDLDSVLNEQYVTQEVYTPDSIYRIPLDVIDSIGFVTPPTIYKSGVKVLEGALRNNILSRPDELTLIYASSTPQNSLPKVGDKLVSTVGDEILESAFIGEVSQVNDCKDGIKVTCEPVALTDVFECYYSNYRAVNNDKEGKSRVFSDGFYGGKDKLNLGEKKYDLFHPNQSQQEIPYAYGADENLSPFSHDLNFLFKVKPRIEYNVYLVVNQEYGTTLSVLIIGDYETSEELAACGKIEVGGECSLFTLPIIIPETFTELFLDAGVFINTHAEASASAKWTQCYKHVFSWNWNSKKQQQLKSTNELKCISNSFDGAIMVSGAVSAGIYGRLGLAFAGTTQLDIARANLRADFGVKAEGALTIKYDDIKKAKISPKVYERLKEQSLKVSGFWNLSAEAKFFEWSGSKDLEIFGHSLHKDYPILSADYVPTFSELKITDDNKGTTLITSEVSGSINGASPRQDIGFALVNKDDDGDVLYSCLLEDYKGPSDFLSWEAKNYSLLKNYTVYPLIKYAGNEMLASPSIDMDSKVSVKTGECEDVLSTSAVVNGAVEGITLNTICSYGIEYKESSKEEWESFDVEHSGENSFTVELNGLEPGTEYSYRAFLFMEDTKLTGKTETFSTIPEITTGEANDITANSAYLTGKIVGFNDDCSFGIEYHISGQSEWIKLQCDKRESGTFTCMADGLEPNAEYVFRAYLLVGKDYYYGKTMIFQTLPGEISIKTEEATNVSSTSAVLNGVVLGKNKVATSKVGFEYRIHNSDSWETVRPSSINDDGKFNVILSGLSEETIYQYRAFLVTDDGNIYGALCSFTTLAQVKTPGVTFAKTRIISTYFDDGEYINELSITVNIAGSENIESLKPIIYGNGFETYIPVTVPFAGDGEVVFEMEIADTDEDFTPHCIGIDAFLKDGDVYPSSNMLQFSGSASSLRIDIVDNPKKIKNE